MVNTVHLIDNMKFMATLPDGYFDLIIDDPEYGIGADVKNSINKKQSKMSATESNYYGNQKWDTRANAEYFKELFRVSKNQIIWGANYFGLIGGYIYWKKNVTMPTYSKGELAYCSLINKVEEFEYTWHGMLQKNMKYKENRTHPTQKPVALYKWLLANYAKPGWKIGDMHVGSGSSRIACHDMGFDFEGAELDPDYHAAQEERYKTHIAQASLPGFEPETIQSYQEGALEL